jgi:hypothetical protein
MAEICDRMGFEVKYTRLAKGQDEIGWWRFLEGMIYDSFQSLSIITHTLSCMWTEEDGKMLGTEVNHQTPGDNALSMELP